MYVPQPYVQDYFEMGWMMARDPEIYHRGGHICWLMLWPCACKPHYLKKRY